MYRNNLKLLGGSIFKSNVHFSVLNLQNNHTNCSNNNSHLL